MSTFVDVTPSNQTAKRAQTGVHCKVLDERERTMGASSRRANATPNGVAVTRKGMQGNIAGGRNRNRTNTVSLTFIVQCQHMATISLVMEGRHSARHMECKRLPIKSAWH